MKFNSKGNMKHYFQLVVNPILDVFKNELIIYKS